MTKAGFLEHSPLPCNCNEKGPSGGSTKSKELLCRHIGVGAGLPWRITAVELNSCLPGKVLGRIDWNML